MIEFLEINDLSPFIKHNILKITLISHDSTAYLAFVMKRGLELITKEEITNFKSFVKIHGITYKIVPYSCLFKLEPI